MCDSCRRKKQTQNEIMNGSKERIKNQSTSNLVNKRSGGDRVHNKSGGLRKTTSMSTIPSFRNVMGKVDSGLRRKGENKKMSDIPSSEGGGIIQNGPTDMAAVMENFQKKGLTQRPVQVTTSSQILTNASQLSTSSSSSLSSRVAKSSVTTSSSSSRVHHHVTSSTSSELKASSMKSDIAELKSSISEMKSLSEMKNNINSSASSATQQEQLIQNLSNRLRSSLENLVDTDSGDAVTGTTTCEPLVTFPDTPDTTGVPTLCNSGNSVSLIPNSLIMSPTSANSGLSVTGNGSADTLKFEQKRMHTASKTKVVTDGFSAEKATANSAEMKRLQAGDVSYQEKNAAAQMRARLEMDGVLAEKNFAKSQEQRSLKTSEMSQQDIHNRSAASLRLQGENFSSEKKAMSSQQQRQTVTASSVYNHEKQSSSQSNFTITTKGVSTKSSSMSSQLSSQLMNGTSANMKEEELLRLGFEDLDQLCSTTSRQDVEKAIQKYSSCLSFFVQSLLTDPNSSKAPDILNKMNEIIRKAWSVPTHGHELGLSLCNTLRNCGGLDLLMSNCMVENKQLQYFSAQLLEQCLTTENRAHVVENGLDKVVNVACVCTNSNSVDHSRVGTGILEHLFKHSEQTCCDVIQLGGLDAVLFECRMNDVETLRHCAGALANLSLYGGADNQEKMIKRKVPMWLFPLAFHNDDNIKYYACLAIAVLVANKEIEAAVLKSGTLDLVEPFVTSHNPFDFAKSNLAHAHGQSKNWLQRLVPVLSSEREEARNLAAFHFCMEAGIKKQQGNTEIFSEIGAIEPLKKVASCPNAVASKYAAQALRLMGEEVPHKLSQQVPLWSTEDVKEWVKQIGFSDISANFVESRVDGDLLLQINEENLKTDIGLVNGIQRQRFTRELQSLKKMADYSSRDTGNLNHFLQSIGPEFSIYTYSMLNAGVDKDSIRKLSEDQLVHECGIPNSIHRLRILEAIRSTENSLTSSYFNEESHDKSLDVFVSYRRSNGSQLASLLKVHLQLRGFSVFIDVERLEAGKFDNNLLQSIRQAKHFLLVLTPQALERCKHDHECKDWVHREIVAALQSQCNIIPIIDNFQWPEAEELPEDMRAVCHFNGVRWIHDYQDACVDKLERFLRGELNMRSDNLMMRGAGLSCKTGSTGGASSDGTPGTPASSVISRHPPSYQRMHSNDSGSGKGSDKDVNGNGGGGRE